MKNFRIEIKWAIIFTIASMFWIIIEKLAGFHDEKIAMQPLFAFLFAIPAIVIYVFALREKRQRYFNGLMSWQQGFISGLFLAVFIAVLSPAANYISYNYISPEYFPNMITHLIKSGKMSESMAISSFNSQAVIKRSVTDAISMGVITSAVIAFFIKTKTTNNEK